MKLSRSTICFSIGAVGVAIAIALAPRLLGSRFAEALDALQGADSAWLALAAGLFGCAFLATVGAWRAALAASGGRICPVQAASRIGVGSLVNSFAPAKLGDAVKIALCSKAITGPDRLWTAGGVYAALGATRLLMLAGLVVAASAAGALPLWPVFVLCGIVGVLAIVALTSS